MKFNTAVNLVDYHLWIWNSSVLGGETSWVECGQHQCLTMLHQGRKGEGKRILIKIISKIAGRKTWDRLLLFDHREGGEETGEQDTFLRTVPADLEQNFPSGIISEQLTYYSHSLFLLTLSLSYQITLHLPGGEISEQMESVWGSQIGGKAGGQSSKEDRRRSCHRAFQNPGESELALREPWLGSHICCEAEKADITAQRFTNILVFAKIVFIIIF